MVSLRPLSSDRATALSLARRAILARNAPDAEIGPFLSAVERDVANGTAAGVLRFEGRTVTGIALWEPPAELGATLQVLYGVEGHQTGSEYERFLREVMREAGPVVFAPGFLAGLDDAEEQRVMEALGYAKFARSEMRLFPDAPEPHGPDSHAIRTRAPVAGDAAALARLHELAYRGRFDRFLFLVYADPARDAELATREILSGRWGEFLPWASVVVEGEGRLLAAALVVRAPYGPLIADVMVEPVVWGHGLGRAVVTASIRALRGRERSPIVLNVTEGNARAVRLYEHLGFVRSLGPSHGWYSRERIPIGPDAS